MCSKNMSAMGLKLVPVALLELKRTGIIIRVDLCWNFGRLVIETSRGYRDELKTPSRDVLGAHFGHKTCQTYWVLRSFKTDLLFILGEF